MTPHKRKFQATGPWFHYRRRRTFLVIFIIGFSCSISMSWMAKSLFLSGPLTKTSCSHAVTVKRKTELTRAKRADAQNNDINETTQEKVMAPLPKDTRKMVLIGVMTSERFIESRAKAVNETWARSIASGMTLFFIGDKSRTNVTFGVVKLPQVDDGYPPQRKSFHMLKYLHDNYIDDFHWFMRADDDVYVNTERLTMFLRKLDSSENFLIGHSGIGKPHEKGKLGLGMDNFCLGGPGVVMSQSVLRKVAPHLITCLNETVTDHEDTELGRCIRRYVGVTCPWAQQARNLFNQIYEARKVEATLSGDLDKGKIGSAITVHPVKEPDQMFLLHSKVLNQKVQRLASRVSKIRLNRDRITKLLSGRIKEKGFSRAFFYGNLPRNSSLHWASFDKNNIHSVHKPAVDWVSGNILKKVKSIISNAMHQINTEARQREGLPEDFKKLDVGWMRIFVTRGVQLVLDLTTIQRSFSRGIKGRPHYKKRHLHLEQTFAPLLSRTMPNLEANCVHFIVPLAGRLETFQRFLLSYEKSFIITKKQVSLLIVYFPDVFDPVEHKKLYEKLSAKYPNFIFNWLELAGEFSRARALELGAKCCGDNALLFFCDVDFVFQTDFYDRCRTNTSPGERVYFPVFFSEYQPLVAYYQMNRPVVDSHVVFEKRAGIWRKYSFGPACVYAADVIAVGGLDTSIRGWGLEDLDFFEKCLKYSLDIHRAPDMGLVHVYHRQTNCLDKRLSGEQAKMCNDSRLNGVASAESLTDYLLSKGYL